MPSRQILVQLIQDFVVAMNRDFEGALHDLALLLAGVHNIVSSLY